MSRSLGDLPSLYRYSENCNSCVCLELTGLIQPSYFLSPTTSRPAMHLPPGDLKEFAKQIVLLTYVIRKTVAQGARSEIARSYFPPSLSAILRRRSYGAHRQAAMNSAQLVLRCRGARPPRGFLLAPEKLNQTVAAAFSVEADSGAVL